MADNIDYEPERDLSDILKANGSIGSLHDAVEEVLVLRSLRNEIDESAEGIAKKILSGENTNRARRGEVLAEFIPKAQSEIPEFLRRLHASIKSLMEKGKMDDLLFLAYPSPPPGSVGIVWELRLKSNKKNSEKRPVRM